MIRLQTNAINILVKVRSVSGLEASSHTHTIVEVQNNKFMLLVPH